MIHTYENALQIRKAYEYLIEKYDETGFNITDICIIPADLKRMAHFLKNYKLKSAFDSLMQAGFDRSRVRIVVIHEQTLAMSGYMIDLDEYLTKKGIKKAYDNVTKTYVTMN
ncbi:MAG: hypothetical protein ABI402_20095 [Ferruginibacter sp.]